MNRLFDKVPEELFSPLSRKYKAVYAFSLVSLYHMLRLYHTDIKRADYVAFLKSQGQEMMNLFSVETDRLDDKSDSEQVELPISTGDKDDAAVLSDKENLLSADGISSPKIPKTTSSISTSPLIRFSLSNCSMNSQAMQALICRLSIRHTRN